MTNSTNEKNNVQIFPNRKVPNTDDASDNQRLKAAERELMRHIVQTQKEIRRVDLLSAVCAFATLALALLLFGIILDCWILSDGLSPRGRVYYAIFWAFATLSFFFYRLIPVFSRRVNVTYAAKALEDVWQDKHNFTINWLQLCRLELNANATSDISAETSATRQAILRGVTLQAAANAKRQNNETVADFSGLIRWGIAFATVVAVIAGYAVFSPKNPFTGAGRIIAPLAKIERPQALHFKSIEPGDVIAYQGDFIEVNAEIPGADSLQVELLYSSEDRRLIDVSIPMESLGSSKFHATLPNDEAGLSESITYRILVGRDERIESSSEEYTVTTRPQPSFRVEKTTFTFPEYTGLSPQTFENQGEIRALEGTVVKLEARCNADLERAVMFPDGSQPRARKMTVSADNPKLASIEFPLSLSSVPEEGVPKQEFEFYQLVSHDIDGQENRDQQNYPVSILLDQPPTVRWTVSSDAVVDIPLNDVMCVSVLAEDPDFSLRSAQIQFARIPQDENATNTKSSKNELPPHPLLLTSPNANPNADYTKGPTPFVGSHTLSYEIEPKQLGLSVGDYIEYWVVAYDSKLPAPNSGSSSKRRFRVVEPVENPSGTSPEKEEESTEDEQSDSSGEGQNGSQEGAGVDSDEQDGSNNDSNQANENGQGEESEGKTGTDGESGEESEESGADGTGEESDGQGQNENGNSDEGTESSTGNDASGSDNSSSAGSNSSDDAQSGTNEESTAGNANASDSQSDTPTDANVEESDEASSSPTPSASSSGQPIDPETNPGDAFEAILNHMQATGALSNNDEEGAQSASGVAEGDEETEESGNGNGEKDGQVSTDSNEDAHENEEEAEPNFDSQDNVPKPSEKRDLPTRTSSDKPEADSPSYQANDPSQAHPDTPRRQGKIDPNTNDYLAQNADPNAPATNNPKQKQDANITLDPFDQTPSTAASGVNSDAPEAKGNAQHNVPDAPYEIDQDSSSEDRESDASDPFDLNDQPEVGSGGSNGTDSAQPEDRSNGQKGGGVGDAAQSKADSQNEDGSPSNRSSAGQAPSQRGGGSGTGQGELDNGKQTLAPADKPKLRYAEEASNLVLNYLEDALKDQIDRDLLNELGWTEEQLRQFLEEWKKRRADAESGNRKAKEEYLRKLSKVDLGDASMLGKPDDEYVPRESKSRSEGSLGKPTIEASRLQTPDRLSERVRAFTQGVSRAKQR